MNEENKMSIGEMSILMLIDKDTPKKGILIAEYGFAAEVASHLCCPNCKNPIVNVWNKKAYKPNYCHYCGQALDWSE